MQTTRVLSWVALFGGFRKPLYIHVFRVWLRSHCLEHPLRALNTLRAAQAFTLFERAVQSGNAAAYNGLGYMHMYGHHVERNQSDALHLFREAAAQGSMDALYNLGVLHLTGSAALPVDEAKARGS